MYRLESIAKHNIVILAYSGHVSLDEAKRCRLEVAALLASIKRGFRLFTDLGALEVMDFTCAQEIRLTMDDFRNHGVSRIVRILPKDRRKDIGFTTMSTFHYGSDVSVQTVETFAEALEAIES